MGLFSKIFGGATDEGTDSSSKEASPAEPAADAAASKAAPATDAQPSAAAQPPLAKAPASRREPERAPEARPSVPARKSIRTDGLFAPPDAAEPRVVVAQPPRAPAVPDTTSSRSAAMPPRTPAAEASPPRQASPQVESPASPAKAAAAAPAAPAAKAGASAAKTAARESSRPGARGAKATPPKSPPATRATKTGKQPVRADASSTVDAPSVAVTPAPAAATDAGKTATLDLDSLPPPAMNAAEPPRARMESEDDVDRAFAFVESSEAAPGGAAGTHVVDPITREHNANLFRQMAVGFARPVRDFMLELVLGPTTKQWLDIAKGPVQNLLKGASEFELSELAAALVEFGRGLDEARNGLGAMITGPERERLLARYEALARALPMAFDLKDERSRREPMIVHHLLLQVPGVHKLAIDKLYAAGLASLDGLGRSSVGDLMAHARLDRDGAEGIVRRFRGYLRERTEQVLEKGEVQVRQRLLALIDELGKAHQEFQRADADEDRTAKRRARVERRARALEMNVLLAQLGEIDLIAELERSATDRRIERVRTYVESSGRGQPMRQETV
jgi:hypothetical protein